MPALVEEFGADYATHDGALDRAKMRALVFADPGARRAWKPSCTRASAKPPPPQPCWPPARM
jgi:hypothetical protein